MEDLEYMLQELQARSLYLETSINSIKDEVEDFQVEDDRERGQGGGSAVDWSYKVTAIEGLKVRVSNGYRIVIHKSSEYDAAQTEVTLGANSTTSLYAVYTYATESTAASWTAPTWGTPPAQNASYRVFVIAEVNTNAESIDSIIHRHCGNLEVYDLVQC